MTVRQVDLVRVFAAGALGSFSPRSLLTIHHRFGSTREEAGLVWDLRDGSAGVQLVTDAERLQLIPVAVASPSVSAETHTHTLCFL